ncbi:MULTISPECIES: DUF3618 domain-containing protein [unclassified Yoonia]|uniref:DUF3618 domain-containing protein n=1 Tax=unclassified Yoonia TaxID=2629118 RepID=UPI002AFFE60D|nr:MULTISPECIES: DUF3618 domain-containing protein [unclassified Yoonia]
MTDHRSTKEIERDLEEQREGLADSLDDLKEKFSVDTMVREAANQIREHSGDIGASVTRAVKENPLGVALTGVGLAWLIFGERRSPAQVQNSESYGHERANRPAHDPYGAYAARRDPVGGSTRYEERSVRDIDTPSWARGFADSDGDISGSAVERTKEGLKDRAGATRDRASALRARLSEGTEELTEEGRARVMAAREKATQAREAAMSRMSDARDKAVDLFEEQPLIAGALALAVGAAIGAALPHTRFEDDTFGDTADDLMHEAERIYAEERAKLGAVAQKAVTDMGEVVEKAASDALGTLQSEDDDKDSDSPKGKTTNLAGKSALQDEDMPQSGPGKTGPGSIPS